MPRPVVVRTRAAAILAKGNMIGPERYLNSLPPFIWISTPESGKMEEDGAIWNDINALDDEPNRSESVTITN